MLTGCDAKSDYYKCVYEIDKVMLTIPDPARRSFHQSNLGLDPSSIEKNLLLECMQAKNWEWKAFTESDNGEVVSEVKNYRSYHYRIPFIK